MLTVRPKLKFYNSYEQAKEEVEKLQLELYPILFKEDSTSPMDLDTIAEEGAEATDTNNDYTEETSEALGSDDDDDRQRHAEEEDDDEEEEDEEVEEEEEDVDKDEDSEEVS